MNATAPTKDSRTFPTLEEGQRYLTLNGWESIGMLKGCWNGTRYMYGNPDNHHAYVVLERDGDQFRATSFTA